MPAAPSTARGEATSRRILNAATEEFAERGIAGARIERIVATARTNKAQLYGYFGNKEDLFAAVMADAVERVTTAIPFDADDLAGWAVGLYDENVRHPDLVRLTAWIVLERRPSGVPGNLADREFKVASIAAAQAAGKVRAGDPVDLMAMVIAMACAWSPVSNVTTATAADPEADHDRRRELLRDCVQRAVQP